MSRDEFFAWFVAQVEANKAKLEAEKERMRREFDARIAANPALFKLARQEADARIVARRG